RRRRRDEPGALVRGPRRHPLRGAGAVRTGAPLPRRRDGGGGRGGDGRAAAARRAAAEGVPPAPGPPVRGAAGRRAHRDGVAEAVPLRRPVPAGGAGVGRPGGRLRSYERGRSFAARRRAAASALARFDTRTRSVITPTIPSTAPTISPHGRDPSHVSTR